MKKAYRFIVLLIVIIMVICSANTVSAMKTGMTTVELSEEEYTTFIDSFDLQLVGEDFCKDTLGITCFDVNDSGELAVGYTINNKEHICVHNKNGDFLFGYSFDCYGTFAFEWDDDCLIIYYIRGGLTALIDRDGKLLEVKQAESTPDNSIYLDKVESTRKEVGNTTCFMKKGKIVSPYYSIIIATDENGIEKTVFETSEKANHTNLFLLVGIIVFVIIGITGVTLQVARSLKQHEKEYAKKQNAGNSTVLSRKPPK